MKAQFDRRSKLAVLSMEKSPAINGKAYLWISERLVAIDLNVAIDDRILPNGVPRTGALPCVHGFRIGPTPT